MASREDSIYFARLAEQAERYEDMIKYMKTVAHVSAKPSPGVFRHCKAPNRTHFRADLNLSIKILAAKATRKMN